MIKNNFLLLVFFIIAFLFSCATKEIKKVEKPKAFTLQNFYDSIPALQLQTDSLFKTLTDKQRVGQMVMVIAGKLGKDSSIVSQLIVDYGIGGILVLDGSSYTVKQHIQHFTMLAKRSGALPLLFSCDAEPSLLNHKITGLPRVPNSNQISSTKVCWAVASQISEIVKDLGYHMNFAPVCDFSKNKAIIGNRSFGNSVQMVGTLPVVFLKTSQELGVVATAKHFPGHGTVKHDSHHRVVFLENGMPELPVFQKAIDNKVISVMVGHIAVKNDSLYDTNGQPASISRKIVTGLLRDSLHFKGLVITDAMNMGAVMSFSSPSLNAVKAGCDIILGPSPEKVFVNSVHDAMQQDSLLKQQVYQSVKKIIKLKICLGMFNEKDNFE